MIHLIPCVYLFLNRYISSLHLNPSKKDLSPLTCVPRGVFGFFDVASVVGFLVLLGKLEPLLFRCGFPVKVCQLSGLCCGWGFRW